MIIDWVLETGFTSDCVHSGSIELDDDTPDEKIEEIVKEEAFNNISWNWWKREEGSETSDES